MLSSKVKWVRRFSRTKKYDKVIQVDVESYLKKEQRYVFNKNLNVTRCYANVEVTDNTAGIHSYTPVNKALAMTGSDKGGCFEGARYLDLYASRVYSAVLRVACLQFEGFGLLVLFCWHLTELLYGCCAYDSNVYASRRFYLLCTLYISLVATWNMNYIFFKGERTKVYHGRHRQFLVSVLKVSYDTVCNCRSSLYLLYHWMFCLFSFLCDLSIALGIFGEMFVL